MNISRLLVITLLILATIDLQSARALSVTPIKNQELRACLLDPRFVKLSGAVVKAPGQSGYYSLPDEDPLHPDGIYSMELMQCADMSNLGSGITCIGFSGVTLFKPRHGFAKLDCARAAMSYAHDHFAWLFKPGLTTASSVAVRRPDLSTGVWTFSWFHPGPRHDEDLHTAQVSVDIRSLDGKVVGFEAYRSLYYPVHKVDAYVARTIAFDIANKEHPEYSPRIDSVAMNVLQTPYWSVTVVGTDPSTGAAMERVVELDVRSGHVVAGTDGENAGWAAVTYDPHDMRLAVVPDDDRMPIWTREGLVFLSNRRLTDLPEWSPQNTQAMMVDGAGRLTYVTAALSTAQPEKIDGVSAHSALNVQISGRVYSVDLKSGKVLKTPTLADNAGQQIERGTFLVGSPKWAYFIGKRRDGQTPGQTLYRIPVAISTTGGLDDRQPEIVVALLPADVTRISQFGSTDKLLIQAKSGMFTVDGETKRLDDLTLPTFKDPDVGGAAITDITDGYSGPTESTILFSGCTLDAHAVRHRRIYQCSLDGSGLKALTPLGDMPVTCHRFSSGQADGYALTLTLLATAVSKNPDLSPDAPLTLPLQ